MQIKAISDGSYFTREAGNKAIHFALRGRPKEMVEGLTLIKAVRLKFIYKDKNIWVIFNFIYQSSLSPK